MIILKNISKNFTDGNSNVIGLKNINLTIKSSDFITIIGSNGSGKSTLLNIIAGTIKPSGGDIFLEEKSINALNDFERSKWIGRVFQNPLIGTASELSILENFRMASLRSHMKKASIGINSEFVQEVKDKVILLNAELENKLNQPMGTLSGGQRQALTLLMATWDKTSLLLMDEPTASLDPKSADLVMDMADKLIQEFSIPAILVTHNLKDAQRYGNRLLHFKEGSIVKDVCNEEKAKLTLEEMYSWFN